jgi:hypothetical protein
MGKTRKSTRVGRRYRQDRRDRASWVLDGIFGIIARGFGARDWKKPGGGKTWSRDRLG